MIKIETAAVVSRKTGSKFAVIVRSGDQQRSYVYDLKPDVTLNCAELLAVKFALIGIKTESIISTSNTYVSDMLRQESGGWAKSPKSNKELVDEIRNIMASKNVQIIYERNDEVRKLCTQ